MPGLLHLLDWNTLGLGQADDRKERVEHHTAGKEQEHSELQHRTPSSSSELSGQHAHTAFPESRTTQGGPGSVWALHACL